MVALAGFPVIVQANGRAAGEGTSESVAQWLATVNDPAATEDTKNEAIDSLVEQYDPALLDTIKYFAFRFPDRKVNLTAIDRMNRFVRTYRWIEVCDTLTDLMLNSSDAEIRFTALNSNKMTAWALINFVPYDRNRVVDALITMISPDTYFNDAKGFYAAVWLLANVAVSTDLHAVEAVQYVRDHFSEYTLVNGIDATDAYQLFLNNIQSKYIEFIENYAPHPLIDTFPENAATVDYISTVGYMLDSAATDSLGFAALAWLKENGETVNGDEGRRLQYFYTTAAWKRPDRAVEIMTAVNGLFPRFGVAIRKDRAGLHEYRQKQTARCFMYRNCLTVGNLSRGDHIRVFDYAGKLVFGDVASRPVYRWVASGGIAPQRMVVTVNGAAFPVWFSK